MAKFGKWITGGLGWAFFGPIGGILGFVVGSLFDGNEQQKRMFAHLELQRQAKLLKYYAIC